MIEKGPRLIGKEGVVDKDLAAAILAHEVGASRPADPHRREEGAARLRLPLPEDIDRMTVAEAKALLKKGEFGAGSMGPKVAGGGQLRGGGRRARGDRRPGRRVGRRSGAGRGHRVVAG